MLVLGISGSLRRDSFNRSLLVSAAELAPSGVELLIWDGLKEVPPYSEDDDVTPAPAAVAALRAAVAGADAVVFATPEYNHSIPGQLKNAIDWLSRPLATNPLRNMPVAVVGASTGMFGAVWAQAELRKVAAALGARVVGTELPVGHARDAFAGDGLADEALRDRLASLLGELVAEARPVEAVAA